MRTAGPSPCGQCLAEPPPQDAAQAPLLYSFPVDRLITRFKFEGDLFVGTALGQLLAEHLTRHSSAQQHPDRILPMPLHPHRLRQRSFNQAGVLARQLARALAIPVVYKGLRRTRATPAQTGLGAAERRRSLKGAFAASASVAGRHLALVDDVMTTGATARSAAAALKAGGAERVELWCLARRP